MTHMYLIYMCFYSEYFACRCHDQWELFPVRLPEFRAKFGTAKVCNWIEHTYEWAQSFEFKFIHLKTKINQRYKNTVAKISTKSYACNKLLFFVFTRSYIIYHPLNEIKKKFLHQNNLFGNKKLCPGIWPTFKIVFISQDPVFECVFVCIAIDHLL